MIALTCHPEVLPESQQSGNCSILEPRRNRGSWNSSGRIWRGESYAEWSRISCGAILKLLMNSWLPRHEVWWQRTVVRTSLVVQWIRISLPIQGTRFSPWSGKIPHASEQLSTCTHYWTHLLQLLDPVVWEPVLCIKRSPHTTRGLCLTMKGSFCLLQLAKAHEQQWRPGAIRKKKSDLSQSWEILRSDNRRRDTRWTFSVNGHWRN